MTPALARTPEPAPTAEPSPGPHPADAARGPRAVPVPTPHPPTAPAPSRPELPRARPLDVKRLSADGDRLALRFWEAVSGEDRQVQQMVEPGSPADIAVSLWGPAAAATLAGVRPGWPPNRLDTRTTASAGGPLHVTSGVLYSGRYVYPYALRWCGQGRPGAARVAEVVPGRAASGPRLTGLVDRWWSQPYRRRDLPAPRQRLDGLAADLFRVELPERGPVLLMRALAAWHRIDEPLDARPGAVAAALARLVAEWSGTSVTIGAVARQYGADESEVRAVGPVLRRLLPEGPVRGW